MIMMTLSKLDKQLASLIVADAPIEIVADALMDREMMEEANWLLGSNFPEDLYDTMNQWKVQSEDFLFLKRTKVIQEMSPVTLARRLNEFVHKNEKEFISYVICRLYREDNYKDAIKYALFHFVHTDSRTVFENLFIRSCRNQSRNTFQDRMTMLAEVALAMRWKDLASRARDARRCGSFWLKRGKTTDE